MAPPILDAAPPSPEVGGYELETSYLEPEPPPYRSEPATEPEPASLEPEPPTFRDAGSAAPAGAEPEAVVAAAEESPVDAEPPVEAAPAASVIQREGQLDAGRQPTKLEQRLAQLAPPVAAPTTAEPAIGVPDVKLFDCPACGRPLERGTSKCSNCGTRLVGGRPMRRVATFAGIAVVAVLILGTLGMTALAMAPSQPSTGNVPGGSAPASQPAATAVAATEPAAPTGGVPGGAGAALVGTAVVNGRITTDSATLAQVLSNADAPTIDVARAMRALAADAQLGLDMTGRLTPWTDAKEVATKLDAFYGGLADTAREALRVSLNDATAYRSAGAELLAQIRGLAEVDAATRDLATTAGLSLPALPAPGISATPSP